MAFFDDLRECEQEEGSAKVPPVAKRKLRNLSWNYRVSDSDTFRIRHRAHALIDRRAQANGTTHLRKEERDRLRRRLGEVPAVTIASEHQADEIAASLHEEMPWMAPATEAACTRCGAAGAMGNRSGPGR